MRKPKLMGITQRITKLLNEHDFKGASFTADEVKTLDQTLSSPHSTPLTKLQVTRCLHQMHREGKLGRLDRGRYLIVKSVDLGNKPKKEESTPKKVDYKVDDLATNLKKVVKEFDDLMLEVFSYLEYTKEIESSMKFWMERAKEVKIIRGV